MYIYITKKDKNKAILKVTLFYTQKTCNNHRQNFVIEYVWEQNSSLIVNIRRKKKLLI